MRPSPSSRPRRRSAIEAGERYKQVLGELGVTKVRTIHAVTRAQANDETVGPRHPRRDRHLHDRRQPAAAVVDDRRDAARRRGARPVPPGRRRRRARAPAPSAMSSHMIAFGAIGRDAEAPDGPDRGRPRRAARGHRRPALPAAEPARPAAQPHRPEPVACSASASTRTPPASSGPDHIMEVIGRGSITVVDGARSPRPTPGRSRATGR